KGAKSFFLVLLCIFGPLREIFFEQAVEAVAPPVEVLLQGDYLPAGQLGAGRGGGGGPARRHAAPDHGVRQTVGVLTGEGVELLRQLTRPTGGEGELVQPRRAVGVEVLKWRGTLTRTVLIDSASFVVADLLQPKARGRAVQQ